MFLPFRMFFEFVENSSITEFEDEMEFPFPPKNLDQIHQIRMLQILGKKMQRRTWLLSLAIRGFSIRVLVFAVLTNHGF